MVLTPSLNIYNIYIIPPCSTEKIASVNNEPTLRWLYNNRLYSVRTIFVPSQAEKNAR